MYVLDLKRIAYTPLGTFGVLDIISDKLYTIERPWVNNEPFKSCIPEGLYTCNGEAYYNKGGYKAIEVEDVPGRSNILFHKANTMTDVEGCIGVGLSLGIVNNQWAVTSSMVAFSRLMDEFDGRVFQLYISGGAGYR